MSEPTQRADLASALRDLAWTVHNSVPDRAGIDPVPRTELTILKRVLDEPGSTVGELATATGMRQPNASSAIRRLADRGLVELRKDEGDRRVSRIHPSERSLRERALIEDTWSGSLGDAFRALGTDDRAALLAAIPALRSLNEYLHAVDAERSGRRL